MSVDRHVTDRFTVSACPPGPVEPIWIGSLRLCAGASGPTKAASRCMGPGRLSRCRACARDSVTRVCQCVHVRHRLTVRVRRHCACACARTPGWVLTPGDHRGPIADHRGPFTPGWVLAPGCCLDHFHMLASNLAGAGGKGPSTLCHTAGWTAAGPAWHCCHGRPWRIGPL